MNFSYFQKMSEAHLSTCEKCSGNIKRVITGGSGLIFKGSGFYLTDYKDGNKTNSEAQEKDADIREESKIDKTDKKETKSSKSEKKSTSKKEVKSDESD